MAIAASGARRHFAARNCRRCGGRFLQQAGRRRLADRRGGGRGVGIGQPVDRLLRQRAIDPGLQIKGQQLPDGRCGFRRSSRHHANLGWIAPARNARSCISMVVLGAKIGNNEPLEAVLNRAEIRS